MLGNNSHLSTPLSKILPSKTRRKKGEGTGYIYSITITRKGKQYPEFYYRYRDESGKLRSISLQRQIRLVYLLNNSASSSSYAVLFCPDLQLDAFSIYLYYKARFQIEFVFRDSKQFTGLAYCQARDLTKLDFHFNSSLTALNLAKWDAVQQHNSDSDFIFSMASYKRRSLNHHLLEQFINKLDLDPTLIKSHPNYSSLYDYGAIAA